MLQPDLMNTYRLRFNKEKYVNQVLKVNNALVNCRSKQILLLRRDLSI